METTAMRLILASNNAKKLLELDALFRPLGFQIAAQGELDIPEAAEPFGTYVENALAKARHAARQGGGAAIADDSGISVHALGGAPGVHSARYAQLAGRPKTDAENNLLLLEKMQGRKDRRARFVSALVALRHADDPEPLIAVGRWEGQLLEAPKGEGGFGYDPLLFIPELGRTVAELDAATKNRYSHRALAAQDMARLMQSAWLGDPEA